MEYLNCYIQIPQKYLLDVKLQLSNELSILGYNINQLNNSDITRDIIMLKDGEILNITKSDVNNIKIINTINYKDSIKYFINKCRGYKTHIELNDTYNLIGYSNDWVYKIVCERRTDKSGAAFDADGKCLQHTFQFNGWGLTLYKYMPEKQTQISGSEWRRLKFTGRNGNMYNMIAFSSKPKIIDFIKTFMKCNFSNIYDRIEYKYKK